MDLKNQIKNNLYNSSGWKTNRKIVVLESDDWGSARMKSKKDFDELSGKIKIGKNAYNRYDALETETDLQELYNCLQSVRDINGNCLKITANFIVSNPDFGKIKDAGFSDYFYEDFIASYKTYYDSSTTFNLIRQGIDNGIFFPQFHGREHLQVDYWMRDLKANKKETKTGFEHAFFGFGKNELDNQGYLSAFNATTKEELELVKSRISEGLELFEKHFGFKSDSVIAPQNTMHHSVLPFLKQHNVNTIQGARVAKQTPLSPQENERTKRFIGRENKYGQLDIVRNVTFEPSNQNMDWVNKAMSEIKTAFFWKKPAVICTHRVNYMGFIDENNRMNGLKQLKQLLQKVQQKWPDVEFMTTVELAETIEMAKKQNR